MGIPKVNIELGNGNIGSVAPSTDGISALICTGASVVSKIQAGQPYKIYSLLDAEALGVLSSGTNAFAHKIIKDFYASAPDGTELNLMVVLTGNTMAQMLDITGTIAPLLLDNAGGKVRQLAVSCSDGFEGDLEDNMDVDVANAMLKGQALCEAYAENNKPLRFIVDGKDIDDITGLRDYSEDAFNRGSILISTDTTSKVNSAVGIYLGQLAALPVQRRVSRVKNGPLPISAAYFTNMQKVEKFEAQWETLANRRYVFFMTYTGKGGYYFSGDQMACPATDDYSSMARGRVIDKAARIAYTTFVNELDDDLDLNAAGQIDPAIAKALQGTIENAVNISMAGEISAFTALINPAQDVLAVDGYTVECALIPKGYAKTITIKLNYSNPANL